MTAIQRRVRIDLFTPAERAIYDAVQAVEAAGADVRLTQAVILLSQARDKVADYVDGVPAATPPPEQGQEALREAFLAGFRDALGRAAFCLPTDSAPFLLPVKDSILNLRPPPPSEQPAPSGWPHTYVCRDCGLVLGKQIAPQSQEALRAASPEVGAQDERCEVCGRENWKRFTMPSVEKCERSVHGEYGDSRCYRLGYLRLARLGAARAPGGVCEGCGTPLADHGIGAGDGDGCPGGQELDAEALYRLWREAQREADDLRAASTAARAAAPLDERLAGKVEAAREFVANAAKWNERGDPRAARAGLGLAEEVLKEAAAMFASAAAPTAAAGRVEELERALRYLSTAWGLSGEQTRDFAARALATPTPGVPNVE